MKIRLALLVFFVAGVTVGHYFPIKPQYALQPVPLKFQCVGPDEVVEADVFPVRLGQTVEGRFLPP